ncbi:hypothetical protein ACOSP7_010158 [Xanthoceras sorbifolium]
MGVQRLLCMRYRAALLLKIFVEAVPPPANFVKLNSDAALASSRSLVGVGLVLRDDNGRVVGSSGQCFGRSLPPLAAEGEAVLRGLKFALDVGVSSIVVESDASSLVDLINGKIVASSKIDLVMDEIQSLCSNFQNCSFIFGSRKVNWVAHNLAKFALSFVSDFFLVDDVPSLEESFVRDDRPE